MREYDFDIAQQSQQASNIIHYKLQHYAFLLWKTIEFTTIITLLTKT